MTPQRKERMISVLDRRQGDLTVVLENVFDPHNISAVMRSCDAVGVTEIFVLNTKLPRHKKWGPKSSSSAHKWILVHQFTDPQKCFAAVREKYRWVLSTHVTEAAKSLYDLDFCISTALVFGNEHSGVSPEIRRLTDGDFVIPQVGMIKSLNISVACAVSLYEAFRQKNLAGHYDQPHLDATQYQTLLHAWEDRETSDSQD